MVFFYERVNARGRARPPIREDSGSLLRVRVVRTCCVFQAGHGRRWEESRDNRQVLERSGGAFPAAMFILSPLASLMAKSRDRRRHYV